MSSMAGYDSANFCAAFTGDTRKQIYGMRLRKIAHQREPARTNGPGGSSKARRKGAGLAVDEVGPADVVERVLGQERRLLVEPGQVDHVLHQVARVAGAKRAAVALVVLAQQVLDGLGVERDAL